MSETLADALMSLENQEDGMKTPKNEDKLPSSINSAEAVVSSPQSEDKEVEVPYDDFSKRTATRDFEFVVEDRVLFVNAYWLGELSPYFYDLFFGDSSEGQRKSVTLLDESYDSILELLRCVIDCPVRKPIEEANINDLLDMSEAYKLKGLHRGCVKYINEHLRDMSDELVLELLQTAAKHKTDAALLKRLGSHISNSLPLDQLESLRGKVASDVLVDMYIIKTRSLCAELDNERARNATANVNVNATSMADTSLADISLTSASLTSASLPTAAPRPTKKRKLAPDAVDLKTAFACIRCKRDGRAPAFAVTALCSRCGSYRCLPTCTRSTCKGH
uniref:BTB domain-containing protein n=1 Tax=Plectus sambesii TaxID=2011161 RepID=A0A914VMB1_9BILA